MRLQRALARAGVASRRRSEDLIRAGKVRVNGRIATIGMLVDPGHDTISVDDRPVRETIEATIVLHKPVGVVVSRRDPQGRDTVYGLVPEIPGLTYVGRLDVMTSGLLIMTTDGELANRLTHPRYEVERAYRATVRGLPPREIRRRLREPILIDGRPVAIVRWSVRPGEGDRSHIVLVLTEGRNRVVRRACEQLGLTVERLVRTSHGPITLGNLEEGTWRHLTSKEESQICEFHQGR